MKKYNICGYDFDELPENIQTKILDNFRYYGVEWDWWEYTYDYFCNTVLPKYGITANHDDINFHSDCYGNITIELHIPDENIDVAKFLETCGIELPHKSLWNTWMLDRYFSCNISGQNFNLDIPNLSYNGPLTKWLNEMDQVIGNIMANLTHEMEKQLESEYEYLISDDYIMDMINANEYVFTETGELLPSYALEA